MGILDAPGLSRSQADTRYPRPVRQLAARGLISDTRFTSTSGNLTATSRLRYAMPEAATAVRLVFANFYVPSGSGETTNAYTLTVKASVEDTTLISGRSAGTTMIPVFFNGKRSATLEAGGILISDPVFINTPDAWALFVRTNVTVATIGDIWPTPYPTSTTASVQTDGSGVSEGVTLASDLTDSGSMSGTSAFAFGPCAIIGEALTTAQTHATLLAGDSIVKRNGVINAVGSYHEQAAINAGLPTMRIACGGEAFSFVKSQANFWRRMQLARFARNVICGYGINDVRNGSSLATLKADAQAVWTIFSRLGLKVHQTTLLPNPGASTDGYLTASGQSIVNSSWETVRTGFNSWLRDASAGGAVAQSGGALTSVIDGAALIEVNSAGALTINGGFWKPLASVATVSGTATGVTTTTVTDSGKTRTTNQDQSLALTILSATTGAGQIASVKSNTATVWSISAITLPSGTVTYQIAPSPTWDHLHPTEAAHALITSGLDLSYLKAN